MFSCTSCGPCKREGMEEGETDWKLKQETRVFMHTHTHTQVQVLPQRTTWSVWGPWAADLWGPAQEHQWWHEWPWRTPKRSHQNQGKTSARPTRQEHSPTPLLSPYAPTGPRVVPPWGLSTHQLRDFAGVCGGKWIWKFWLTVQPHLLIFELRCVWGLGGNLEVRGESGPAQAHDCVRWQPINKF